MQNPSSTTTRPGRVRKWVTSPILPVLAATLGSLPLQIVHFQQLWIRPHYQYFPLVLLSVVVLYQPRRTDPDLTLIRPRPWLSYLALLAGLGLATYAVLQIK